MPQTGVRMLVPPERDPEQDLGSHSKTGLALEALQLVPVKPRVARDLAVRVRRDAASRGDHMALSLAEEALGLAAKQLDDIGTAIRHLRSAVQIAERRGLEMRAAEARINLSIALAWGGQNGAALREADRAAAVLTGRTAARLQLHRGIVLQRLGHLDKALESYRQALTVFRRHHDLHGEARLLNSRGVLHAYRGEFRAAEADLLRSEQLHLALGEEFDAAKARSNLGFVAGRRGDVPAALRWFDRATEYFSSQGMVNDAVGLLDRCEVLLSVHLAAEAREAAEGAVAGLAESGMGLDLAEARLMLSHAALLDGDVDAAREAADLAERAFTRQRRTTWAALARYATLRAACAGESPSLELLRVARRTAAALDRSGWTVPALDAQLIAARTAMALGKVDLARRQLDGAGRARRHGPVELRARAWHAEALLRLANGDHPSASRALRAGLHIVDQYRAALGATELRTHVSAHGEELAALGLQLSLEGRRPAQVFAWAERWRAACLRLRPARPPEDAELAADIARLRQVATEVEQATLANRDTTRLAARQAALERAIRDRTRHAHGPLPPRMATPSLRALRETLDGRVLLELVEFNEQLHAIVVDSDRATLHRLAPFREVLGELSAVRFALRRLVYSHGSRRSLDAATLAASYGARRLDELLIGPLNARVAGRPLVIAPTGALHALPWSMLPSLTGVPITVSPSAMFWRQAVHRQRHSDGEQRVLLVAGPQLRYAVPEIDALAHEYPAASRLVGNAATVEAVTAALDGASLAHIAAHGSFRSDNPLFSSIQLTDGRLTVYDLETLRQAPQMIVLSACDSGLSDVQSGDELMGLAATLFSLGTCTLIASVVPVPDDATSALMLAVHRWLRRGLGPAAALARAQIVKDGPDDGTPAARAGFVCFGAG